MPPTLSIRRGFCPICFRGDNCTVARVQRGSPCIDEELLVLSKLPLLDLTCEGERCKGTRCKRICLVCGNPTAFPCEPDYDEALDAVDQYEEDVLELQTEVVNGMHGLLGSLGDSLMKDALRRLERRLRKIGMAWHPRWRKVVHARCIRKEACGCVLTAGAESCKDHPVKKPRVPPRRPPAVMPFAAKPAMPEVSLQLSTTVSKRPISMGTCTWLPTPTSSVAITLPNKTAAPPAQAKLIQKAKPPPPKPNARLAQAAKGCGKIDAWRKGENTDFRSLDPKRSRPPFDLRRYEQEFDPFLHGYFRKNGVDMFRFPDGWVEQVYSPVNRITEDGHLVPG